MALYVMMSYPPATDGQSDRYPLQTKVMDRTLVILDNSLQGPSTREGKIQVELAQLRYRDNTSDRIQAQAMSRLGGGIGREVPARKSLRSTGV